MKSLLFSACLLAFAITSFAQSRVDKVMPVIEKQSPGIDSATGWTQNGEGKWIANKNAISDRPVEENYTRSFSQNFEWLRMAKVAYGGKSYYMVYCKSLHGYFKYPEIREDWSTATEVKFFLFDSAAYFSFKNGIIKKKTGDNVITSTIGPSTYPLVEEEPKLVSMIEYELTHQDGSHNVQYFIANVQKDNGADIVRFQLPFSLFFESNAVKWSSYFEVPYTDFLKIFVD